MAAAVAALVLAATPATAQQTTISDPAGDAANHGFDIVRTTVHNRDHGIVVRVRFTRSVRGDLIVSVDRRKASGLRLVSEYRPLAHTENLVLGGAFTDKRPQGDESGPKVVDCPGFRVRWSADRPVARLRMPSRCLADGDYGAVRVSVLTERGSDADYAPGTSEGEIGTSDWVPRG